MAKFTRRDFPLIAEYIIDEYKRRKRSRSSREKEWAEIDRQIDMIPDTTYKKTIKNGRLVNDPEKAWMPEGELPLQAQSLEVLTADARRMQFPDSGPWFSAHAALTDKYLERIDFQSIISGDENEVPTQMDQDAADKLVHGVINHWHRQYDFRANIDLINAEAFKYGMGVGRARIVNKKVLINKATGIVSQSQKFPALIPKSIKHTYLDDRITSIMNEGHVLGPAHIFYSVQSLDDLKLAAKNGSNDPEREDGGWMPANIKSVEGDKNNDVEVLEYEGDLIVPKSSGNIHIPGAIVTVIISKDPAVIRLRLRKHSFSSYLEFPYHNESIDNPYSTSPLMKGWPIQKAAVDALNRLSIVAALHGGPPVSWDSDDPKMQAMGGPKIKPYAVWETTGKIDVHQIGDPSALFAVYQGFLAQYADVVGINAPRLGAQTTSHTTAFAKEAEISRGTIRTVDYVKGTLKGPLAKWLDMAFVMGKDTMKQSTVYIEQYRGFVDIDKDALPDMVVFDAHGSGGPQEEQAKSQKRLQSLQMALQMDQLGISLGRPAVINLETSIHEVLTDGGWTDTDIITNATTQDAAGQPGLSGTGGGIEASPAAALQALAFGGSS